jgi:hypothetical protein
MKKYLPLFICMLSMLWAQGQEITEGKVDHLRKDQPALIMELPYPPDVVEDAIKDYLNKKGSKSNSSRGYQLFKDTKLSELDTEGSDLYFKVERKSRKEKDVSVVYFYVTRPNENFKATTTSAEMYNTSNARSFLSAMLPAVEAHNLEVEISAQEGAVKKAEKKYDRLTEDGENMEKRLKQLQEDIEANKKELEKQKQEIAKQKNILDAMRNKRKG